MVSKSTNYGSGTPDVIARNGRGSFALLPLQQVPCLPQQTRLANRTIKKLNEKAGAVNCLPRLRLGLGHTPWRGPLLWLPCPSPPSTKQGIAEYIGVNWLQRFCTSSVAVGEWSPQASFSSAIIATLSPSFSPLRCLFSEAFACLHHTYIAYRPRQRHS